MKRHFFSSEKKGGLQRVILPVTGVVLLIVLVYTYGFGFHQISSLGANYSLVGSIACLVKQGAVLPWDYCELVSLPTGQSFVIGLPVIYAAYILAKLFFLSPQTAFQIVSIVILAAGLWGGYALFTRFAGKWSALFGSFLYLFSFTLFGQAGFGPTMFGFILLPLLVLMDVALYQSILQQVKKRTWGQKVFCIFLLVVLAKITSVFMDGYSFVMYVLMSGVFLSVIALYQRKQKSAVALMGGSYLVSTVVAYMAYTAYTPGGANFSVMPIDFFRAQGIDLISLVVPRMGLWLSDVLGYATKWNAYSFYGDGSNVNFSFLGYTTLLVLILFFILRWSPKKALLIGLAISGLLAFLLALGPSVKINDQRPAQNFEAGIPSFKDYLMPAEDATLNLHTDFLYQKVPGIKNMRQVSRWIVVVKLSLAGILAFVISALWRQNKKTFAVVLVIFSVLEITPNYPKLLHNRVSAYQQLQLFHQTAAAEIIELTEPGEKVYFLSSENDFLGKYLAIAAETPTFTTSGDKNLALVIPRWPQSLQDLRAKKNVNANTYTALQSDTVDAVILPFFSLRLSTYSWPPPQTSVEKKREELRQLVNTADPRFTYQEGDWFGIVRLKQ